MDDGKRGLEENIANVEMLPIPIPIVNKIYLTRAEAQRRRGGDDDRK